MTAADLLAPTGFRLVMLMNKRCLPYSFLLTSRGVIVRATWKYMLDASKHEAVISVDLYNRTAKERSLEGFYVHMHLAWLYLFQAQFKRDGVDYRIRQRNGRFKRIDGQVATWSLKDFTKLVWPNAANPARANLETSMRIRNRIEHRYENEIALATAGFSQALLLNYEETLVATFGREHSLGSSLRFPVFIQAISPASLTDQTVVSEGLPDGFIQFLRSELANRSPNLLEDPRYEFRVHLIPKVGPKSEADVALSFVRRDELTEDEVNTIARLGKTGTVFVREKDRQVANAGLLKPTAVAEAVQAEIQFRFSVHSHFHRAWKKLGVRPLPGADAPERTIEQYCVYDEPNESYLYTPAFVAHLTKLCDSSEGFRDLTGLPAEVK